MSYVHNLITWTDFYMSPNAYKLVKPEQFIFLKIYLYC